jgi:hypothetical protein
MASVTVTSIKEIRCPIDVVRAQFSDLKHHIAHNVHRNLELTLCAFRSRSLQTFMATFTTSFASCAC